MSQFNFYHPVEVRYGDLDPQGHVNNAKHLTYFEQARIAYLIELGLFTKDQSFMEIGIWRMYTSHILSQSILDRILRLESMRRNWETSP